MLRLPSSRITLDLNDLYFHINNMKARGLQQTTNLSLPNEVIDPDESAPQVSIFSPIPLESDDDNGDEDSLIYSKPDSLRSPKFWKELVAQAETPWSLSDIFRRGSSGSSNRTSQSSTFPEEISQYFYPKTRIKSPTGDQEETETEDIASEEEYEATEDDDKEKQAKATEPSENKHEHEDHKDAASWRARLHIRRYRKNSPHRDDEESPPKHQFHFSGFTKSSKDSRRSRYSRKGKQSEDRKSHSLDGIGDIWSPSSATEKYPPSHLLSSPPESESTPVFPPSHRGSTAPRKSSLLRFAQAANSSPAESDGNNDNSARLSPSLPRPLEAGPSRLPAQRSRRRLEKSRAQPSWNNDNVRREHHNVSVSVRGLDNHSRRQSPPKQFEIFEDPFDLPHAVSDANIRDFDIRNFSKSGEREHWRVILDRRQDELDERIWTSYKELEKQVDILHDQIITLKEQVNYMDLEFPDGEPLFMDFPRVETLSNIPDRAALEEAEEFVIGYTRKVSAWCGWISEHFLERNEGESSTLPTNEEVVVATPPKQSTSRTRADTGGSESSAFLTTPESSVRHRFSGPSSQSVAFDTSFAPFLSPEHNPSNVSTIESASIQHLLPATPVPNAPISPTIPNTFFNGFSHAPRTQPHTPRRRRIRIYNDRLPSDPYIQPRTPDHHSRNPLPPYQGPYTAPAATRTTMAMEVIRDREAETAILALLSPTRGGGDIEDVENIEEEGVDYEEEMRVFTNYE
ncbi:MAG: hypothetical protein M1834_009532 [Cirrosporium novae-zelandiae]|nr:MAG: hypothetical protein M1834_009532 [Cirrosporium novae-zelandiae]